METVPIISVATLIQYGTPVILLALMLMETVSMVLIILLWGKVRAMEQKIVWRDTYLSDDEILRR